MLQECKARKKRGISQGSQYPYYIGNRRSNQKQNRSKNQKINPNKKFPAEKNYS